MDVEQNKIVKDVALVLKKSGKLKGPDHIDLIKTPGTLQRDGVTTKIALNYSFDVMS